ncbi:MAG: M28 family peptidase, partial [Pseudohongiella sp.]
MTRNINHPDTTNTRVAAALAVILSAVFIPVQAQTAASPWYGVPLPPAFTAHDIPAIVGSRGPAPAVVPAGEELYSELQGQRLLQDLHAIIEFSHQSRRQQELGGDQMWGRVAGFPSGRAVADWAAQQFRSAGITQVATQSFSQEEVASLWLPVQWEVRLLANSVAGAGSDDVVLTTAVALAPSQIPDGILEAPMIYVGTARPAELAHMDVSGKIAIQHITPQAHLVFERAAAVPRAQDLMERGAVAVLNIIDQPGNEMARDLANCGGPCFNIGGRDGVFLANVLDAAANNGDEGQLRARLSLQAQEHSGLTGHNVIAVIPGASDETIVLNAHLDAWYDGAGDNGDGVAVMMALARHFSRPEIPLQRTLVLVASAGHHTTGLNGPRNAVRMNPDLFNNSV